MKCPRDGTGLSKVRMMGVELDKCHACDGIWFDRGELERLRDSGEAGVEETIEETYGNPATTGGEVAGYMRCPSCGGRLLEFNYSWVQPVKVDRCDGCSGIWLDKGELAAITAQKKAVDGVYTDDRIKRFVSALWNTISKKSRKE